NSLAARGPTGCPRVSSRTPGMVLPAYSARWSEFVLSRIPVCDVGAHAHRAFSALPIWALCLVWGILGGQPRVTAITEWASRSFFHRNNLVLHGVLHFLVTALRANLTG